ncbi:MAG: SulP family inorganic anion transporter [Acidimicrobiia bacterium]|nr:SulP family inorganic anion transporter [Acidimicrobiia bacterium]
MTLQAPQQSTGVGQYVPGLASISQGVRHSPIADGRAALTVWAVVVPQSLAYGTLAGVPSVHGLYAAVGALAVYALFGTCRDLNMGAESTVAIMAAAAVAPLATDADDVIELTALAALLVGGWCVLGFVFRLGFISEFLSRPILAGYVFGSGIIIVVSQLESLFGLEIDTSLYTTDIGAVVQNLGDAHGLTTAIGISTVVLVFGMRELVPKIPAPLVAVVLGIVLVVAFDLDDEGIAVVGSIDSGVPVPGVPNVTFDQFTQLLFPALGIALLAYPDSFLTARSLSASGGYTLDADQEFLALGASNVASGFLQGFPVNGSQSRSFVQRDAGGKTNLVGLICAALVLITLFFLTGLFEKLPLSVLAGIVIVAGIGLFALDDFKVLWRIRRSEFWLGAITVVAVLVLGMLGGIAFAIGLSLIVTLARVVRPHTAELGQVEGTDTFRDVNRNPDANAIPGLLIYRIDDELFFANAAFFVRDVKTRLVEAEPPATALVIDAEGVSDIDTTAIQQLEELLDDLSAAGVTVTFARVRQPVREMLHRSGILEHVGDNAIFLEIDDAVQSHLSSGNNNQEEEHGS